MTISEPSADFGLWPRVKAITGWPESDEVAMAGLAQGWRTGAEQFGQAGRYDLGGLPGLWPDGAGTAYAVRAGTSLDAATSGGESMAMLAERASFFAGEVTRVKTGIRDLILTNLPAFAMIGILPPGVRQAAEQAFVMQLAGAVDALISEAAGRIAAHGRGYDFTEFVEDVGGFFKGVGEQLLETGQGLLELPGNLDDIARRLWNDPGGLIGDAWQGAVDPIVEDWKNGNQGEAIGRATVVGAELLLGGKGLGKLGDLATPGSGPPSTPDVPPDRAPDPGEGRPTGGPDDPTRPSRDPDAEASPRGERTEASDTRKEDRGLRRENEAADLLARNGYDVEQNPPPRENGRRPDYLVEGRYFDNYAPTTANPGRIRDGISAKVKAEQADRIVLHLDDSPATADAVREVLARRPVTNLKEVILVEDGVPSSFYPFE